MKKLRFLMLDANIVIQLFEFGIWDNVLDKTEILLARTVAEREAEFFFINDERHEIDLAGDISASRVSIVDATPTELKKFVDRFDLPTSRSSIRAKPNRSPISTTVMIRV